MLQAFRDGVRLYTLDDIEERRSVGLRQCLVSLLPQVVVHALEKVLR